MSMLYKVGSQLLLETKRQVSISRNLAGANMPGYRREFVVSNTFNQEMESAKIEKYSDLRGVNAGEVKFDFGQGGIRSTDRALDFALVGDGFFEVRTPTGESFYTRNGSFQIGANGELITAGRNQVLGDNGPITFSPTDYPENISVAEDGSIMISDQVASRAIDKLRVVQFADNTTLVRKTANYFAVDDVNGQAGVPATNVKVLNRHVETANFTPVTEMAAMIQSLREYEANQKVLRMEIQLHESANRILV